MDEAKQLDYEAICDKVKDAKNFEEAKAILTPDELIYCSMFNWMGLIKYEFEEDDDAYLVIDILKLIGTKNYSAKYASHILDVANDIIPKLSRFNL